MSFLPDREEGHMQASTPLRLTRMILHGRRNLKLEVFHKRRDKGPDQPKGAVVTVAKAG